MTTPKPRPALQHILTRTSPKGGPFVGTCMLCGRKNLPHTAIWTYCDNPRGMNLDDAVVELIGLPDDSSPTG